jgi:hypothetical protein
LGAEALKDIVDLGDTETTGDAEGTRAQGADRNAGANGVVCLGGEFKENFSFHYIVVTGFQQRRRRASCGYRFLRVRGCGRFAMRGRASVSWLRHGLDSLHECAQC